MSYILDALKKAESERQLGIVPGVHAQPAATSTGKPLVSWLIVGLLALIAILLVWRIMAPPVSVAPATSPSVAAAMASATPPSPATNTGIATQAPAVVASAPAPASQSVQVAPAAEAGRQIVQKEVPTKELANELAVAPVVAAPTAVSKASIPAGAAVSKAASAPAASTALATNTVPASTTTPAPAKLPAPAEVDADESLPLLAQLPEVIQREVPAIAVKGYMYSKNPADRVLIIGSNFHHEGDDFPNGVRLEKLLPKAAVFSYKGFRYRVAY